ncbi:MAG: helix-turn-helix transcriptional regulator [Terriglobales bacterium]
MANTANPPAAFGRQFFGELRHRHSLDGAVLAEVVHEQVRHVPMHTHDAPYFSLVLEGRYEEGDARGHSLFRPFFATFNPQGTCHQGHVHEGGARFFTAELAESWLKPFRAEAMEQPFVDQHGGPLLWRILDLYRNHLEGEAASPLVDESLLWEMLATAARWNDERHADPPAWWLRVREKLHDEFRRQHRLSDLATEAGVHPVYLARVCRRFEHRSIGGYLLALRVRLACELLSRPEWPVAQVAAEAGFADQSHLTRMFKRLTGVTPAAFRTQFLAHRGQTRSPLS